MKPSSGTTPLKRFLFYQLGQQRRTLGSLFRFPCSVVTGVRNIHELEFWENSSGTASSTRQEVRSQPATVACPQLQTILCLNQTYLASLKMSSNFSETQLTADERKSTTYGTKACTLKLVKYSSKVTVVIARDGQCTVATRQHRLLSI
jgi:hypothetical protein